MTAVSTASRNTSGPGVDEALRAAAIQPERFGHFRAARLEESERQLYFWILRQFAAAAPPTGQATNAAATSLDLEPTLALAALAREDLVHADTRGQPIVAYPFSAQHRGHVVVIDGAHAVQAMCAIDALGIAPMLGLPIEVVSHDPLSRAQIHVEIDPGEDSRWRPEEAVVLTGSTRRDGPSFGGCCDVLNFFETKANADRYLHEHPGIAGWPISIPEAIEMGRIVFGNVFDGT